MTQGMKPRSHEVSDGFERAGARAMLRAVGMTDDDWDKAQIGVASSWNEVTPCNMSLDRLAKRAKDGVRQAGGFPLEFVTIAVSDGISMGHEGMRASLVSREIIADSVEVMMHAERLDGMVTFAGCDKSLPGMLMAAARLNLPSVFLYGGTILPGRLRDQALDIVSVFEAVGAHAAGGLSDEELSLIERNACPTVGPCAGMFTANTMASVAEALGMSLPGSSAAPAVDRRRDDFAFASGRTVVNLLEQGIRPRRIMTKEAFENAIARWRRRPCPRRRQSRRGRPRRAAGLVGPQRRRGQDRRRRPVAVRRDSAGLGRRGQGHGGELARGDRAGRHRREPLRGTQG